MCLAADDDITKFNQSYDQQEFWEITLEFICLDLSTIGINILWICIPETVTKLLAMLGKYFTSFAL